MYLLVLAKGLSQRRRDAERALPIPDDFSKADGWMLFQVVKERTWPIAEEFSGLTLFMAEEPLTEEIASRCMFAEEPPRWVASHAIV